MKILVQKTDLVAALKTADEFTIKGATTRALGCVMVEAKDGAIRVVGNSLGAGVRASVDGQILESGAVGFEPKPVIAALKTAHTGIVRIETTDIDESQVRISFGQTKIEISGVRAGEFPAWLDSSTDATAYIIDSGSLVKAFLATISATDKGTQRPILYSVHLEIDGNDAVAVANDGRRMHTVRFETRHCSSFSKTAVNIQVCDAKFLAKFFAKTNINIRVVVDEKGIYVTSGAIDLYSRGNKGEYPDWKKVWPTDEQMESDPVVLRSDDMLAALERVQALKIETVGFGFENESLVLRAEKSSEEGGECKIVQTVPAEQNGRMLDGTYFVPEHLILAIRASGTPEVFVRRTGDNGPILVSGTNFREKFHALVMPKRI